MTKVSIGQVLIGGLVVLSLAAVAGGFLVIGSPAKQRLLALDKQRTDHLIRIANAVDGYWDSNGGLPLRLSDIENSWIQQTADPESGEPYTYQVTGQQTYQLCAVFALRDDEPAAAPWERRFATHSEGLHCFDLSAGRGGSLMGFPPSVTY